MPDQPNTVVCHDIDGKAYPIPSDQLTFRPAVYAVIIQNDQILLSKQWDGYDFPGGGINLGESNVAAVTREVREETGLDIEAGRVLFANNSFFKLPYKEKFVHSIHMYYSCKVIGGELSVQNFDEQEKKYASLAEWVPLDSFAKLKFYTSANAQDILDAYFRSIAPPRAHQHTTSPAPAPRQNQTTASA
ncbi:MAG: NUDIX domain-containing protein [bacterium]|nr:NUDIX domain-containing protein [bacterium]